jgi:hypothetical protein
VVEIPQELNFSFLFSGHVVKLLLINQQLNTLQAQDGRDETHFSRRSGVYFLKTEKYHSINDVGLYYTIILC